ncbi:MAG: hypothetical protein QXK67_02755 [Pyrobaculum sp.]
MATEVCLACTGLDYARPTTKTICNICKKEVSWREIVSHYITHGKKSGGDMICPLCNSKVKEREFRTHVRKHFVVQSGLCGICGRRFRSIKSLYVHIMKTHES